MWSEKREQGALSDEKERGVLLCDILDRGFRRGVDEGDGLTRERGVDEFERQSNRKDSHRDGLTSDQEQKTIVTSHRQRMMVCAGARQFQMIVTTNGR